MHYDYCICAFISEFFSFFYLFLKFIYLLREGKGGRKRGRETSMGGCPSCILTGNQTGNPLVCRPALSPLSYTSQGSAILFLKTAPTRLLILLVLKKKNSPGWCGSVDWVPACELGCCQFDSQSGHMPGLLARSLVGGMREATTHWCFSPSLSPSLPPSLKINN